MLPDPATLSFGDYAVARFGPDYAVVRRRSATRPGAQVLHSAYRRAMAEHRDAVLAAIRRGERPPEVVLRQYLMDREFTRALVEIAVTACRAV